MCCIANTRYFQPKKNNNSLFLSQRSLCINGFSFSTHSQIVLLILTLTRGIFYIITFYFHTHKDLFLINKPTET